MDSHHNYQPIDYRRIYNVFRKINKCNEMKKQTEKLKIYSGFSFLCVFGGALVGGSVGITFGVVSMLTALCFDFNRKFIETKIFEDF